jgi:hypothetical protein
MEKNIETKDKKKQEGDEKTKKRKEKNPRLGRVLASGPVLFPPPPSKPRGPLSLTLLPAHGECGADNRVPPDSRLARVEHQTALHRHRGPPCQPRAPSPLMSSSNSSSALAPRASGVKPTQSGFFGNPLQSQRPIY